MHRDIKPANLLWTADKEHVKISDFGVSCFVKKQQVNKDEEGDDDDAELAKTAGSPAFFARI